MPIPDPLAALRARRHATAVAEADTTLAALARDPNDPQARGMDPDDLHTARQEADR